MKYRNVKCQCVMEIRSGKKSYYLWQCDWSQVLFIRVINQVWHFVQRFSSKECLMLSTASSWAHRNENTLLYWDGKLHSHKIGIHFWSLRCLLLGAASTGVSQSHFWANTKQLHGTGDLLLRPFLAIEPFPRMSSEWERSEQCCCYNIQRPIDDYAVI